MKNVLLIILLVVLFIVGFWICKRYKLQMYGIVGISILGLCLWLLVGSLISINVLPKDLSDKLEIVKEKCGDTYIRSDGSTVYLQLDDKWVDINDIHLIGSFMEDLYIEYGGEEIYVGHSGLYNTLKVLESVGLISCE